MKEIKKCSELNCNGKHFGKGYCRNHYYRYIWNPINIVKKRRTCREHYRRNIEKMRKRVKDNYHKDIEKSRKKMLEFYYKFRDKRLEKNRSVDGRKYKMQHHLNKTFGITLEQKIKMIENQKGKCLICSTEFKNTKGTHLDHCHKTGKLRGVLCHKCNMGLGSFTDDIEKLQKAIEYLIFFTEVK